MTPTQIFKEGLRLHKMGLAIHWLHPRSKRPIEAGWGSGPRKPWPYLTETYVDGLNLGVRLGHASKLTKGYLAVVDVDVKSKDPKHRKEALLAAKKLIGANKCPTVQSGRGNGSAHYYCVTAKPFKTWNPFVSDEKVKVYMPSKKPSKKELGELTEIEIKQGLRIAHAWEISLYSDGRQVVLPPSIHPDSGKPYQWTSHLIGEDSLPLIEFPENSELSTDDFDEKSKKEPNRPAVESLSDIKFENVELDWLPISDKVREAIVHGEGVSDRSGYLLQATTALHSAGLGRDAILSVLTDPKTFLGACAYDHAKTKSRARAADWLWKYTVKKVLGERSGNVFMQEPVNNKKLSEDEVKGQTEEISAELDWRHDIQRTGDKGQGPPKSTVENVVLILGHAVGENLVRRNEFAYRDSYGLDTPWGGVKNASITDEDVAKIKYWLGKRFRFEPNDKVILDSLIVIACRNSYDPVCDWLEALPKWDGVARLDGWLIKNFNAEGEPEYLAQVFRKWLVAMVMRAKRPGSKFDWMPIFEGIQGAGKSSFGRLLVGEEHFLDGLPPLADKDSALALQGMWGVEMNELANMRKTELEIVKAYITRTVDKMRPPYGRRWIESPRRCVFFGTTNRSAYLTDDTGNRRFKPLKVGRLNFNALKADRNQLFAEAVHLFSKIEGSEDMVRYFDLTGKALEFELKIQNEKMIEDESHVMYEVMQDFIKKCEAGESKFDFKKFRISELFEGGGALAKWKLENKNAQFASKMLKRFGGEKRMIKGYSYWRIDLGGGFGGDPDTLDFY